MWSWRLLAEVIFGNCNLFVASSLLPVIFFGCALAGICVGSLCDSQLQNVKLLIYSTRPLYFYHIMMTCISYRILGDERSNCRWIHLLVNCNKLRYLDCICFQNIFWGDFFLLVLYSTLLHLPPLRFHCADGCWDRTQDRYNWCIGNIFIEQ